LRIGPFVSNQCDPVMSNAFIHWPRHHVARPSTASS
jgi:hypothetical protein